jgi:hypothetical protein
MRDSPELFGAENLVLAAVDVDDEGKIARWVDYWDSRHFVLTLAGRLGGTPAESFPASFGEENIPSAAAPEMRAFVERLTGRLGGSDATGASTMFAVDAVLEDMTTHTAVRGRAAIERYLGRVIAQLPYGAGVGVRRVLGSATAGGFEWVNPGNPARRGISGNSLDGDGKILQMRSVWDGAMVDDQTLSTLTLAALSRAITDSSSRPAMAGDTSDRTSAPPQRRPQGRQPQARPPSRSPHQAGCRRRLRGRHLRLRTAISAAVRRCGRHDQRSQPDGRSRPAAAAGQDN